MAFLFLFSGWVHSWTFGFVWLNKMAVVLPEDLNASLKS